ncbi:MAG: TIGR03621 family F420-dependent LLM class oxidoreductase [Myxococcota bacterium]|nr:TIGR03621 family F420-dependent LLM class oxidoreductase [Myxococcota bacterium]
MTRPFRFGVQMAALPTPDWADWVRHVEELGFSTVFCPDHFSNQWDPTTLLAGVAAASERLNVGSLVYGIDYRHPVIYAKQAATLHLLSGGRHEFGLGAGWMETDYVQAGMDYERPGLRIERLEEALQICLAMWEGDGASFEGRHYTIREIPQAAELPAGERPKVLVGGGGRRLLSVAGRYADIVGINPQLREGKVTGETPADLAPERVREKVGWVRAAAERAGRDPDALELQSLVFVVAITDDPSGIRRALAQSSGMTVEQVADCPLFLTGSASEIQERLEKRREETGITYVVVQGRPSNVVDEFAERVMGPLLRP